MQKGYTKATQRGPDQRRTFPTSLPFYAVIFVAIGYYLGSQHELTKLIVDDEPPSFSSSLASFASPQAMSNKNEAVGRSGNRNSNATLFQLHPFIEFSEDPELYRKLVYPPVRKLVEKGEVEGCKPDHVKPYLDILRNIDKDPLFYEDDPKITNQTCPVVFLFYFEGGSKIADTFFDFYSNIKTKRCLNFIVSSRWIDVPGTREMAEGKGYKIVGKHYPKQDKTISMSLYEIQKQYGDDVLVSVNDLDHLLVWFDESGEVHRYSSYTDMVRLYAYELLSTKGCSNQNVMERYVVPCTCLMEKNEKYISNVKEKDGVIWSEYGTTNRFHPTGNFYLNRSLAQPGDGDGDYVYSIGTVFANLRKYEVSMPSSIELAIPVYVYFLLFQFFSFLIVSSVLVA